MSGAKAICYSSTTTGGGPHKLGSPHYSYRFAEEKFLRCLAEMAIPVHPVTMPEYYSAAAAYDNLPRWGERHVHLIFRSTESIRVLKNGYNIVCYAWEFPFIKDTTLEGEHPFLDQKRMLGLCDEIWVPCTYTKKVLEAHGLRNVHTIPAPITIPSQIKLPRRETLARIGHFDTMPMFVNFLGSGSIGREGYLPLYATVGAPTPRPRRIYLSVFNPEDFRKNLDGMIRGFDAFLQHGRDDLLIIKALTGADRFSLEQVVRDVMVNKLACGSAFGTDNILVFNTYLNEDEMTMLYDLADFYLCTSIAEGQNLPLLEAMARGVVPVTTRTTAMLDYIDAENAIVIETERRLNTNEHLAGNVAGKPYDVEICTPRQVVAALDASAALDKAAFARLSAAAQAKVEASYTSARLQPLIAERLRAVATKRVDASA